MTDTLNPSDIKDVASAWRIAPIPSVGANTHALVAGVNVRIDVKNAFRAAFKSAIAFLKAKVLLHAAIIDPIAALELGNDMFSTVSAVLEAFRQKMSPEEYFVAVLLSEEEKGLPAAELKQATIALARRVVDGTAELPWYLFMSKKSALLVRLSLEGAASDDTFQKVLNELMSKGLLVVRDDSSFVFKSVQVTWQIG